MSIFVICSTIWKHTQVANYADDTTPFAVGDTWEQVRDELVSVNNKSTKQGNFYFGIRKIIEKLQYSKNTGTQENPKKHKILTFRPKLAKK